MENMEAFYVVCPSCRGKIYYLSCHLKKIACCYCGLVFTAGKNITPSNSAKEAVFCACGDRLSVSEQFQCNSCGKKYQYLSFTPEDLNNFQACKPNKMKRQAENSILYYLAEGTYTVEDILKSFPLETITESFLPVRMYSGKFISSWKGYAYEAEGGKREKIPQGGEYKNSFMIAIPACSGFQKEFNDFISRATFGTPGADNISRLIEPPKYDTETLLSANKEDAAIIPPICDSSELYELNGKSMIEEAILKKLNSENLCSEVTESQNVITIDNVSDIIYFPFAISSFKYKDNIYQTAVEIFKNGNGGGKRPIDKDFKNSIENMSKKYIIIAPIFLILFMLFIKPGIFFLKAINNFKFGVFLAGLLVIGYFALDFYKQKQIEKKANIRRFDLNQIIKSRASR